MMGATTDGPVRSAGGHPGGWRRVLDSRWGRRGIGLLVFLIVLWCLRYPLLRAMGGFLITDDPVAHANAVYVLGGAPMDRGSEAARLYAQGVSERFVFTGQSVPTDVAALGLDVTEGECTRRVAVDGGIPEEMTMALKRGTSTQEEAEALLQQAIADGADTVMIVSSEFHLRRVRFVFRGRFADAGITVLLHGAPSPLFSVNDWWRHEEGLLMLNNEYVKLVYYHWKY